MSRKNCKESKDSNPNWGKKIVLNEIERHTEFIEEVGHNRFTKFAYEDTMLCYGGLNLAYTCVSLSK